MTFDHNSEEGIQIDTTVLPFRTISQESLLPAETINKESICPIANEDKVLKVSRPSYTDNSEDLQKYMIFETYEDSGAEYKMYKIKLNEIEYKTLVKDIK